MVKPNKKTILTTTLHLSGFRGFVENENNGQYWKAIPWGGCESILHSNKLLGVFNGSQKLETGSLVSAQKNNEFNEPNDITVFLMAVFGNDGELRALGTPICLLKKCWH